MPYTDTTPPATAVKALVEGQVPWVFELARRLPRMKIARTEAIAKPGGLYEVNAWIENRGYLPFPTAMGRRNQRPAPAVVTLKGSGLTFLTGRARTPITEIDGNKAIKLHWLVRKTQPGPFEVSVACPLAGSDAATIASVPAPGVRPAAGDAR